MNAYTEGEVAWLLGMSEQEAIDHDGPKSAMYADGAGNDENDPLPTIVRWLDVQRARHTVLRSHGLPSNTLLATVAIAQGATQREAAEEAGMSQSTAGRKMRSLLEAIVAELGGMEPTPAEVRLVTYARAA